MGQPNNQRQGGQGGGGEKPGIEFAVYPFKVAIWQRQKTGQDGRTFTEHSLCLSRSFKRQGSDKYEEQKISLFADDLPKAMLALQAAAQHVLVTARVPQ